MCLHIEMAKVTYNCEEENILKNDLFPWTSIIFTEIPNFNYKIYNNDKS